MEVTGKKSYARELTALTHSLFFSFIECLILLVCIRKQKDVVIIYHHVYNVLVYIHIYTHTRTHTNTLTNTHAPHTHAHKHTHTHTTHKRTHIYSHTHTFKIWNLFDMGGFLGLPALTGQMIQADLTTGQQCHQHQCIGQRMRPLFATKAVLTDPLIAVVHTVLCGNHTECQKCRWQVTPKHAYTFDPTKSAWADYAPVQA